MNDRKCIFSYSLATGAFQCARAEPVIRRGGQEFNCCDESAHRSCHELFQYFKQAALPEFGYEDDLLTMPHSVPVKIQCGGLLQLRRIIEPDTASVSVDNIAALLEDAGKQFGSLEQIPCTNLVDAMKNYRVSRRGGRS